MSVSPRIAGPVEPSGSTSWTVPAFRFALCVGTIVMLGLSWPLWLDPSDFPRVPFVGGLPSIPVLVTWILFGSLLATIGAAAIGVAWRLMLGLSCALLVVLVLQDQYRFQPWVYQFVLTAMALAFLPEGRALGLARLFLVALYLHSGLSKIDASFCREMGATFLETLARPFGAHPALWPSSLRQTIILAMPAGELAVAVGLCFGRARRAALVGALALHSILIGILGPWGLDHSTIVLVWNGLVMVEDVLLFGPVSPDQAAASARESNRGTWTRWVMLAAVLMPFTERWGFWDSWPSFALYASHAERADILLHEDDVGSLPDSIRRHVSTAGQGPWRRLDLTGWSRSVRGVPVYPQARASLGVAEALVGRYLLTRPPVLFLWGRACLLTGERTLVECRGRDAMRRQGDRYRLNAHPAPWPGASGMTTAGGTASGPDAGAMERGRED
jgi:hypothetical protein